METTELLEILNGIFRKVLKRDDINGPRGGRMGLTDQYDIAHRD